MPVNEGLAQLLGDVIDAFFQEVDVDDFETEDLAHALALAIEKRRPMVAALDFEE